jgi:hypothetical protein
MCGCPDETGGSSFDVPRAVESPVIDGECSEFASLARLPFPPPGTDTGEPVNTSTNTVNCRVAWLEGQPGSLHGCCEVTDDDIVSSARPTDPREEIFRGADGGDDRLEFYTSCDGQPAKTECTTKVFINVLSPPTSFAINFPDGQASANDSANVRAASQLEGSLNDGPGDSHYVLEFLVDTGFPLRGGEAGLCTFSVMDEGSDQDMSTDASAFGPTRSVNDPTEWGCCRYLP